MPRYKVTIKDNGHYFCFALDEEKAKTKIERWLNKKAIKVERTENAAQKSQK